MKERLFFFSKQRDQGAPGFLAAQFQQLTLLFLQCPGRKSGSTAVCFKHLPGWCVGNMSALIARVWKVRRGSLQHQLRLQLPVRFHAEGLQPLALRQHAVQPLHQRDCLVDAHLYTAEDGRHLVDLLDLLCIFGILLLALLHEAIKSFHREVHLFKNNKQREKH